MRVRGSYQLLSRLQAVGLIGSLGLFSIGDVSAQSTAQSAAQATAQALHKEVFNQATDAKSLTIQAMLSTQFKGPGVCGDSEPNLGEQCDDGNTTAGDGCSASCQVEAGFVCTEAIAGNLTDNIVPDGSFEADNVGGEWTSINHSEFGPNLICGDSCFGSPSAAGGDGSLVSGNYLLLAGGTFGGPSTGNATHAPVAIPADASTLEFQWATLFSGLAGDPCAGASDGIELSIGGTPVWSSIDAGSCTNVSPYQRVVIDLASAPGGPYQGTTVGFEFLGSATGIPPDIGLTNIMLDDVSIEVPADPVILPTPSMCAAVVCGDGVLAGLEQCDDGNIAGGDGCSAICEIEQPNFVCTDPLPPAVSGEDLADGGLEAGAASPAWIATGTEFAPICSEQLCGAALASSGAFYAWFGGNRHLNAQTLTQQAVISSTATHLSFELLVGICDSADDSLTVEIDGNEIYRYDCTVDNDDYETQLIPLGAFADGGMHTVQFIGNTVSTNGGNSNFFVDNISIKDNVAFPGRPGRCNELALTCATPETFDAGIPADWTVVNLGPDAIDGWGSSMDGICASQDWVSEDPLNNETKGGGIAACADSDATGQIDIDAGATVNEMDSYLCSPAFDLTQVTEPQFSFLVDYQAARVALNDNGTSDPDDDFDDDFLEIVVGEMPPTAGNLPSYTSLGMVFDHLDSNLDLSGPTAESVDLSFQYAATAAHVCFHYRATNAWFAQIDNAALRGSACAPPPDSDNDGVPDSVDNCSELPNPEQRDNDGDGHGNLCDGDLNQDCVVNAMDLWVFKRAFVVPDPSPVPDFNNDGVFNSDDLDILAPLFFQTPGPSGAGLCSPQ